MTNIITDSYTIYRLGSQSLCIIFGFIITLLLLPGCKNEQLSGSFDTLISNAVIIDGTGGSATQGDLLIKNGTIVAIGKFRPDQLQINEHIDAAGRVLTPGFIDLHSHGNPLRTPLFENFLRMGVTTISLGQDGSSVSTRDIGSWMNRIDSLKTGPNIIHFQGHGTLRRLVNAPLQPNLHDSLITDMQKLMRIAMESGSFGLSTGLEYEPGTFADLNELIAVSRPVAEYNGLVMSHVRNEDDDKIEESIEELIEYGRVSGAAVHVSHIKIVFENDPEKAGQLLSVLEAARRDGITITADVYPYAASYTGIGIVFPEWARPPHDFDTVVKQRRTELEQYLRNRIEQRNGPEATLFGTRPWTGMTLAEVADSLNKPFEDVLIDDIGPRGAGAAYFVMNEEVVRRFLLQPDISISSDGSPTMQHPRSYGSFARIIDTYVNKEKVLALEDAIYKMSGLSAAILGLDNPDLVSTPRGIIKKGFAADLLIFNPENVRENATFDNPHQYAEGFDWVIVNGTPVIRKGELTEQRNGKVLRKVNTNTSN